jgi:hypothetical protein
MACKEGYLASSPLCAVCEEGYFKQMANCIKCGQPRYEALALLVVSIVTGVVVISVASFKFHRIFASAKVFSYCKVLISFVTVVTTVDSQFGVIWPEAFAHALDALSVMSFDFSIIGGAFCLVDMSFYSSLLFTTLGLVFVELLVLLSYLVRKVHGADVNLIKAQALYAGIYMLVFAYPVVSVKVVQAFTCHDIDGTPYLRADYSIECYTSSWTTMAGYAAVWVVFYVLAFPIFVIHSLVKEREKPLQPKVTRRTRSSSSSINEGPLLGMLMDDYKTQMPMVVWEGVEMIRKLVLSCIACLWSSKTVTCIASAFLLSTIFLLAHALYYPFKREGVNRLQMLCLLTLQLIYFLGVLMKAQALEAKDAEDLGVLLVVLLALLFLLFAGAVAFGLWHVISGMRKANSAANCMQKLPLQDPCDDSVEFYAIQQPVEISNMGKAFKPKPPAELAKVNRLAKLIVVRQLTAENEGRLDKFLASLRRVPFWEHQLELVGYPTLVDEDGKVFLKYSRKTEQSILAKACRPAILAKNPSFDIEHVRDTFRFKVVTYSFEGALRAVNCIARNKHICPTGLNKRSCAKLDLEKLKKPKEWGWRYAVMPYYFSHRLVYSRAHIVCTSCVHRALMHSCAHAGTHALIHSCLLLLYSVRFLAFDFIMPNHHSCTR